MKCAVDSNKNMYNMFISTVNVYLYDYFLALLLQVFFLLSSLHFVYSISSNLCEYVLLLLRLCELSRARLSRARFGKGFTNWTYKLVGWNWKWAHLGDLKAWKTTENLSFLTLRPSTPSNLGWHKGSWLWTERTTSGQLYQSSSRMGWTSEIYSTMKNPTLSLSGSEVQCEYFIQLQLLDIRNLRI